MQEEGGTIKRKGKGRRGEREIGKKGEEEAVSAKGKRRNRKERKGKGSGE